MFLTNDKRKRKNYILSLHKNGTREKKGLTQKIQYLKRNQVSVKINTNDKWYSAGNRFLIIVINQTGIAFNIKNGYEYG